MRKLAVISASFALAVVISVYLLPVDILPYLCIFPAACALTLYIVNTDKFKKYVLIFASAAIGLLWTYEFSEITLGRAQKYCNNELKEINVRITDYPDVYDTYSCVQGVIVTEDMPRFKTLIMDYGGFICTLEPGTEISLTAEFRPADIKRGEETDTYTSRGIFILTIIKSDDVIIKNSPQFSCLPKKVAHYIELMADKLYEGSELHFMKSLMLGDKSDLYKDTGLYLNMSRSGIMHIVAVSGLHITILVGFVSGISGKGKAGSVICILSIVFFVFLTGCGPSVIRSAFMQTYVLLAPLFKRENDSLTSLAFILAALLFINPFAAASISLQLSFLATFGLLVLSKRIENSLISVCNIKRGGAAYYFIGIVSCSLSVMLFTLPVTAYYFKNIQLLAPLTNCLIMYAVFLCFCGGYLSCIIAFVFPCIGKIFAFPISLLAKYIITVCRLVSNIPFCCIYVSGGISLLLIFLIYGIFICSFLSDTTVKFKTVACSVSCVAVLITYFALIPFKYNNYKGVLSVYSVGQGQCVSVVSKDSTFLIDCGSADKMINAGEIAAGELMSSGRQTVDCLILTHLHKDHTNGVETLCELMEVKKIILPRYNSDSDNMLCTIKQIADVHNIELIYIENDCKISVENCSLLLFAPGEDDSDDENEKCLFVNVRIGDFSALITGDSPMSYEEKLINRFDIGQIDLLVVGHHGSRYSTSPQLLYRLSPEYAVISTGYNSYGHPTYETLNRLDYYKCKVYRTDINDDFIMKIG